MSEQELRKLMDQHFQDQEKIEKSKKLQKELEQKLQKYSPKIEGSIYELPNAKKYVKEQIRKFDWNSYVVSNYYPSKLRDAFFAINFYNIELMRIPENTKEHSLIMGKLDFWEESINQIFQNKPLQEPLSICLHDTCKNNPISKGILINLINARKYEADNPRIMDIGQLAFLAEQVRTNMIFLNLQLLRIDYKDNQQLIECAQSVGRCLGILDYIKRIPYNLRKYRLYMPEEINRKHNVSVRNLWDRINGKPKDQLFDVILEVAAYAKQSLDDSKKYQKDLPPQAFRAFLQAVEAQQFLIDLEKVNFNIFDSALNSNSYIKLPYQIFNVAKKQQFLKYD
ncbi:hypothetical protein IMG5_136840 [Ichthyophthirius multifiliis]|uniref:Uncharacterized protein n=1 Tax=Ichthyophthirius multifiliis TaxID=5932 RepID=G0QX04_ICHMU|nr:hypothetical protein IMG5_136840 [Ichthyophthirius multifiliis]EGR30252.1 hypothetical protein IMG5_136840 [Ichthyophthirius multifiliis]|eukprot:XP_004031848.1 hypothetical protein IMG5_136840 [Ichthyophthirius multifiliis]